MINNRNNVCFFTIPSDRMLIVDVPMLANQCSRKEETKTTMNTADKVNPLDFGMVTFWIAFLYYGCTVFHN